MFSFRTKTQSHQFAWLTDVIFYRGHKGKALQKKHSKETSTALINLPRCFSRPKESFISSYSI